MIFVWKVDVDANAANLTELIIEQNFFQSGMKQSDFAEKLICFGVDDAAVFQGARSGVMQRLKTDHAPYVIHVHDFAHCINLVVEAMSTKYSSRCTLTLLHLSNSCIFNFF